MAITIIVPRLGWSMEEGAFVAWHKKDGEFVQAGEALFSIEGDKAIQEIESIDSGTLQIAADCPKPGESVRVGDVLGHLVGGADGPALKAEAPAVKTGVVSSAAASKPRMVSPRRDLAISPRALRAARELGIDWKALTGTGRTGRIRERDVRSARRTNESAVCNTR